MALLLALHVAASGSSRAYFGLVFSALLLVQLSHQALLLPPSSADKTEKSSANETDTRNQLAFHDFPCYGEDHQHVRLVNGSYNGSIYSGRVEVLQPCGSWATVCDDNFDNNAASVICKMLGYERGKTKSNAHYGEGTGDISMDEIQCKGHESSIFECNFNGLSHGCTHHEDAGVECEQSAADGLKEPMDMHQPSPQGETGHLRKRRWAIIAIESMLTAGAGACVYLTSLARLNCGSTRWDSFCAKLRELDDLEGEIRSMTAKIEEKRKLVMEIMIPNYTTMTTLLTKVNSMINDVSYIYRHNHYDCRKIHESDPNSFKLESEPDLRAVQNSDFSNVTPESPCVFGLLGSSRFCTVVEIVLQAGLVLAAGLRLRGLVRSYFDFMGRMPRIKKGFFLKLKETYRAAVRKLKGRPAPARPSFKLKPRLHMYKTPTRQVRISTWRRVTNFAKCAFRNTLSALGYGFGAIMLGACIVQSIEQSNLIHERYVEKKELLQKTKAAVETYGKNITSTYTEVKGNLSVSIKNVSDTMNHFLGVLTYIVEWPGSAGMPMGHVIVEKATLELLIERLSVIGEENLDEKGKDLREILEEWGKLQSKFTETIRQKRQEVEEGLLSKGKSQGMIEAFTMIDFTVADIQQNLQKAKINVSVDGICFKIAMSEKKKQNGRETYHECGNLAPFLSRLPECEHDGDG